MRADSAEFARVSMRDADLPIDETAFTQEDAHTMVLSRQYGKVLNALGHLVRDIQAESNAGDELCKDLIHESLLRVLPVGLWQVFGYEA